MAMWRRWNNNYGNKGPTIGHPTLIDTTVEEGYLETIPEVDSVKSRRSSRSTTLPELPFRAVPPMLHSSQQQHYEPAWSQPTSTIPDYHAPLEGSPTEYTRPDVSPLSSPPHSIRNTSRDETPISPIEAELPFGNRLPLPAHRNSSRIPRKKVSDENKKSQDDKSSKQETRWDAYSGEPTNSETGKPSTMRPGSQLLEHQYPQLKERTRQILAGIREREAAGRTVKDQQPLPVIAAEPLDNVVRKEPWKGLSGRTTLVDPVQNNPSARLVPISHNQRKINLTAQDEKTMPPETRPESPTHTLRSVASEESIKPIAPLKITTKSRNTSPQSSAGSLSPAFYDANAIHSAPPMYQHPKTLQSPFASPGQIRSTDIPAPLMSTRAESPPNDQLPDTPRTPTPPAPYQSVTPIKMQQMPSEHDMSRFSWTTYSTSVPDTPGSMARIVREESPPPPLPYMPALHIKKRPVSESQTESPYLKKYANPSQASMVNRKPVGSHARPASIAASQLSLSKTLPQIPPEIEATDKIASLEAQLDALSMRKHNTNRIIRDLNENLRKNAIAYDSLKHKEMGLRISNHEAELQNIANEEHDVGLLLHRAQKKRDAEANYEVPTGLWIRRVTS